MFEQATPSLAQPQISRRMKYNIHGYQLINDLL